MLKLYVEFNQEDYITFIGSGFSVQRFKVQRFKVLGLGIRPAVYDPLSAFKGSGLLCLNIVKSIYFRADIYLYLQK